VFEKIQTPHHTDSMQLSRINPRYAIILIIHSLLYADLYPCADCWSLTTLPLFLSSHYNEVNYLQTSRKQSHRRAGTRVMSRNRRVDDDFVCRRDVIRRVIDTYTCASLFYFPTSVNAITPEKASQDYDAYATNYDDLDGGSAASILGIEEARKKMLQSASGETLEIGVGTGLNLPYYFMSGDSSVTKLSLLDISQGMISKAKARAKEVVPTSIPIDYHIADATNSLVEEFGDKKFDTVVDTFSLCVMGNVGALSCLKQIKKVVKPKREGGRILLLENSRSTNALLGWYQDITADAAANAGGKGCVYNQDVAAMIRLSGLQIEEEELYAGGLFRAYTCSLLQ